jgi:hypothetical protein
MDDHTDMYSELVSKRLLLTAVLTADRTLSASPPSPDITGASTSYYSIF